MSLAARLLGQSDRHLWLSRHLFGDHLVVGHRHGFIDLVKLIVEPVLEVGNVIKGL